MRQRTINPAFFTSEQVTSVSIPARLMFVGLWCMADREGRLVDAPTRIRLQVFPGDKVDGEKLLEELERQGLIDRYTTDDDRHYIAIPTFIDYQRVHPHETASKIPAPPRARNRSNHGDAVTSKPMSSNVTRNIKPSSNLESTSLRSVTPTAIFDFWKEQRGKTDGTLPSLERLAVIKTALKAYPVADVQDAIRGVALDPWVERPRFDDVTIVLSLSYGKTNKRNNLEFFRDMYRRPPSIQGNLTPHQASIAAKIREARQQHQPRRGYDQSGMD